MYHGGFSWEATGKLARGQRIAALKQLREWMKAEAEAEAKRNKAMSGSLSRGSMGRARMRR